LARVVVLPSDHYVRDEATLARSLRNATAKIRAERDVLYLLGIGPDEADPELGYILPSSGDGTSGMRVAQFIEKPPMTLARSLIERGGLWNAFILAASVRAFVRLFEQRYPEIVAEMRNAVRLDRANPQDPIAAVELYGRLPELDFSRHVLEGAEQSLRVLPVPPCGWSDLGTPKRVADALRRLERDDERPYSNLDPTAYLSLAAQHARLQMAV
jgi:mannose-1-phosphate guanylyltransferase